MEVGDWVLVGVEVGGRGVRRLRWSGSGHINYDLGAWVV